MQPAAFVPSPPGSNPPSIPLPRPPASLTAPRLDIPGDLRKALTLLSRSSSVRDFLLDPSCAESDVCLLTAPRPAFTILTEEEQVGALPGCIALRYLGVPAFAHASGLSGGAVVTSYAARTHPLHAPALMSDVRVGRYVRDENTGEWCIITRNRRDRLTRLQYVRVSNHVQRERICLTCSSDLFDAGEFLKSVLFQCHDQEWRYCPSCGAPPSHRCACSCPSKPPLKSAGGLAGAAGAVMREGPAKWIGKVRVTVVSNISRNKLLNIDECMDVRASYQPTMDSALAADMQRLAIYEKASDGTTIPAPLTTAEFDPAVEALAEPVVDADVASQKIDQDEVVDILPAVAMTDEIDELPPTPVIGSETPSSSDDVFDDAFVTDTVVFDDPFIPAPRYELPEFLECAMLPADPSTLPGGIELCMDGMDLEEDWCSFISLDRDTTSSASGRTISSAASNHTADQLVPQPVLVPQQQQQGSEPMAKPLQPAPIPTPMPTAVPMPPQFQLPQLQQVPLSHQQAPPAPVSIAMPPVAPKEEAELFIEASEQKPQPMSRGVALAPRPAGMAACADGFIWQMGSAPNNGYLVAARLEAIEKERKAEERRKKNRQAAARSNARKKSIMDGFKSEIKAGKAQIAELRKQEVALRQQNRQLKRQMDMSD